MDSGELTFLRGGSFRRRVLRSLAIALYRRPWLSLLALSALTGAAAWSAGRLELKEDLRAFVPMKQSDEQSSWRSMRLVVPQNEPLTVLIRFAGQKPPEAAFREEITNLLADAFLDQTLIDQVERYAGPGPSASTTSETKTVAGLTREEFLLRLRSEDIQALGKISTPVDALQTLTGIMSENHEEEQTASPLSPDDPVGFFRALGERTGLTACDALPWLVPGAAHARADDRTVALRLSPKQPSSKLFFCLNLNDFLNTTVASLRNRPAPDLSQVRVEFLGRHIDTARRAEYFRADIQRAAIIFLICAGLLLILAFRKAESFLFVGLPPCVGLVWTYGAAAWLTPDINLLTAVFPFLLMTLGVEFTVEIYHRFIEELYRERRYYPALAAAYTEAGRGVLVTTLMTSAVFFSFHLSELEFLRELAVVCGLGIFAMALAPLLLLPPMAAVKSRLARGRVTPVETYGFGLKQASAAVIASPRTILSLGLMVTAYLAFFTQYVQINRQLGLDLGEVSARKEKNGGEETNHTLSGGHTISILVEGKTLDEALGHNDRLYWNLLHIDDDPDNPMRLEAICSVSPILPSPAVQTAAQLALADLDIAAIERSLAETAIELELDADRFTSFTAALAQARSFLPVPASAVPFDEVTDPQRVAAIQKQIVKADGLYRVLTLVAPAEDLTLRAEEFRRKACRKAYEPLPRFNSEALQKRRDAFGVIRAVAITVLLSAIWVIVCLAPHFRSHLSAAFLSLLPLTCAAIWTFGFLVLIKFRFGLHALLIFPVLLGLAMNQAIIFIQRLHDRRYASLRQMMRAGGRACLVAGLLQILSLGCLAQARFQALHEMASVALVAIIFSQICTLALVPAILRIFQEGGFATWTSIQGD